MASEKAGLFRLTIIFLLTIGFVACVEDPTVPRARVPENGIKISLANLNNTEPNGKAPHQRTKLRSYGVSFVEIIDIPASVSFGIVQIHAPEGNLTLVRDPPLSSNSSSSSVSGSNIGLQFYTDGNSSIRFIVKNNARATLEALVAVVVYDNKVPTPGGCNMEFDVEIAPFQKLIVDYATITIDSQPASAPRINGTKPLCDKYLTKHETYRMYLPSHEFATQTYFDGILKMMTVESIIKNGIKIQSAPGASSLHRVYSSYPGTGSVHAIIATYENFSAAYVPIATYGCNPQSAPSSCEDLHTRTAKLICISVLVVGFLIVFWGRKFSGFELFAIGAIAGGLLVFTVMTARGNHDTSTVLGNVYGLSFLSGSILCIISCIGLKFITNFLISTILGFFVSSTFYFGALPDYSWMTDDSTFWPVYGGTVLLIALVVTVLPVSTRGICCSLIGAYAMILSLDYYAGSNLKYIIINTVRRIAVDGFNVAVIEPPFQCTDKWLVALFVTIALIGIYKQVVPRSNRTTVFWKESEPLLSASRSGRRILVLRDNDRVSTRYQ